MNPITALFDPIEKLITEHGSAAILREHLSLLKTKVSILQEENRKLKAENDNLRIKIQEYETIQKEILKTNQQMHEHLSRHENTSTRYLNVMGVKIPYRVPDPKK